MLLGKDDLVVAAVRRMIGHKRGDRSAARQITDLNLLGTQILQLAAQDHAILSFHALAPPCNSLIRISLCGHSHRAR